MAQKYKELLLADLCARLHYGVKIKLGDYDYQVYGYDSEKEMPVKIWYYYDSNLRLKSYVDVYLEDYHPYLRSMSSMSEEEYKEYEHIATGIEIESGVRIPNVNQIEWLNKNYFDYRDLIPKGLAIEAPEGMYNQNLQKYGL